MRIVWSPRALRALNGVLSYLNSLNPQAAVDVGSRLRQAATSLGRMPQRCRNRGRGLRRMPAQGTPYLITYRIDQEQGIVRILAVRHGHEDEA